MGQEDNPCECLGRSKVSVVTYVIKKGYLYFLFFPKFIVGLRVSGLLEIIFFIAF